MTIYGAINFGAINLLLKMEQCYGAIIWYHLMAQFYGMCVFRASENFSLDLAFNIRGQRELNTSYSSSEPNGRDIVNGQSGGDKLKYVLKFYIGIHIT